MISLGIPWNWILAAAAVCGAALLALSFLRPRCREKVVPSIMLWQGAEQRPLYRVLWRRLAQLRSLLAPALAVAAMLLFLADPAVRFPGSPPPLRTVVVADLAALKTACDYAAKLDPLHTAVVLADAGGTLVRDFGEAATVIRVPEGTPRAPEWHTVSALANRLAGKEGTVHVFCSTAPQQLPERAVLHVVPSEAATAAPDPVAVYAKDIPPWMRLLPGVRIVDEISEAEVKLGKIAAPRDVEEALYASELYLADAGSQRVEVKTVPVASPRTSYRTLGTFFALLALAAAAVDFILRQKNRTV